jgi:three-Cys-motif partner protein
MAVMALDPERYVIGDDGRLVEKVGPWANEKLEIVGNYIHISGATRRKYRKNRPAFIDVFCGPGRSLVRTTGDYIDGSPVAAFKESEQSLERFVSIEILSRSYLMQRRSDCGS